MSGAEDEVTRTGTGPGPEMTRPLTGADLQVTRAVSRADPEITRRVPDAESDVTRRVPDLEPEVTRRVPDVEPEKPRDGGTRLDLLAAAPIGWTKQPAEGAPSGSAPVGPARAGTRQPTTTRPKVPRPPMAYRPRFWWQRTVSVLSGIATLVLIAAAAWTGWQWWQRSQDHVKVSAVAVAPATPLAGKCNVRADIVGTLTTNGKSGTVSYEWVRSDGQRTGVLQQSVATGQTIVQVHLIWEFRGKGTLPAAATLRVVSPGPIEGSATFTYSCK